ncbi:MAG: hypothetical protein M3O70_02435 [Actinomycetota bacterium]|nr:hypothetical protein [Actinomycetota bacterium]
MNRWRLSAFGLILALIAVLGMTDVAFTHEDLTFRWDIVSVDITTKPPTVRPGGKASARAQDGSKITLTGKGTFKPEEPERVTGGGKWATFASDGKRTAHGTYEVTRLVHWKQAPGTAPEMKDKIGRRKDARAGLAVLQIEFSNGESGTLVVSCHLVGTPDSVFEGITASMGFVDYWQREAPSDDPFVDANRTLFHLQR